jgi:hypothetical protein
MFRSVYFIFIPLQALRHWFPVLFTCSISIMAAFSCDGDNDVIEDDIDGIGFAGATLPSDFCQKGILRVEVVNACFVGRESG